MHKRHTVSGADCFAHVDLIAGDRTAGKGFQHSGNAGNHAGCLAALFLRPKDRFGLQQTHATQCAAVFGVFRVRKRLPQHLKSAADAHEKDAFFMTLENCRLQTALPQPPEICHGAFGSRKQDHIRHSQFATLWHIANRNAVHLFQRLKIGKVRDTGQPDHSHIQKCAFVCFFLHQPF